MIPSPGLRCLALCVSLLLPSGHGWSSPGSLPTLGDASTSIISPARERQIGQAWLRMLRAQAPTIEDPLLLDYLESLITRLASHSDLEQPMLSLVIMDSPEINAFAAPGGVMGINAGLFLHARTENELSAVIAHELAHMSQRHFARGLESQQKASYAGMAALLASVVLAATTGADAGMAALAGTQAGLIERQLRFSRHNEREADQVGMQTLVRAGMAPSAMADFFEQMQKANRFSGGRPPEFLLTHPITESRISEARNRAARLPNQTVMDSLDFRLMRSRMMVRYAKDPSTLVKQLREQAGANEDEAIQYGLALAALRQDKDAEALALARLLRQHRPERVIYRVLEADVLLASQRPAEAIEVLEKARDMVPDNFAVTALLADAHLRHGNPDESIRLLRGILRERQSAPHLWNRLAEAYGKKGDRLGVHQSQAEYYFEHGLLERAEEQLRFALPLAERNFETRARIEQRLQDVIQSREHLDF